MNRSAGATLSTMPSPIVTRPNTEYATMIIRPLRLRGATRPSAKPPTRLPTPMAVSMKAYVPR